MSQHKVAIQRGKDKENETRRKFHSLSKRSHTLAQVNMTETHCGLWSFLTWQRTVWKILTLSGEGMEEGMEEGTK